VRSGDFFDAGNHPEILFSSTRGELSSDGGARVEGELTMRGITRPLVATGRFQPPVQDPFGATRAALELRTVLDRRDWGFSWQLPLPDGRDALGWMVEVTAQLELVKQE
jgi:polyisoprenoid-binding protein YceI